MNSFKAEGEALNFAVAVTDVRRFLAATNSVISSNDAASNNNAGALFGTRRLTGDGLSTPSRPGRPCGPGTGGNREKNYNRDSGIFGTPEQGPLFHRGGGRRIGMVFVCAVPVRQPPFMRGRYFLISEGTH